MIPATPRHSILPKKEILATKDGLACSAVQRNVRIERVEDGLFVQQPERTTPTFCDGDSRSFPANAVDGSPFGFNAMESHQCSPIWQHQRCWICNSGYPPNACTSVVWKYVGMVLPRAGGVAARAICYIDVSEHIIWRLIGGILRTVWGFRGIPTRTNVIDEQLALRCHQWVCIMCYRRHHHVSEGERPSDVITDGVYDPAKTFEIVQPYCGHAWCAWVWASVTQCTGVSAI